MENKNNPLSPHLQIYRWHISSLLSIAHRIIGIINFLIIIFLSFILIIIDSNFEFFQVFFKSFFGKFFLIATCWSFSFQILSEIRHLIMDMGYAFELQATRITGLIVIFGSFILTILIFFIGKNYI